LLDAGAEVSPLSIDQFAAFIKAESEKYQEIVKQAG
jgi:tripartite-type tricarboxylate transporter receptor subunit TctC